ncbi:MAG: glycosyltransferase family 39 protein [Deltaproteobacteria bacterium]|nr:glycosyltransferase family 39 protein [Deltaproteobacteria bacterium]
MTSIAERRESRVPCEPSVERRALDDRPTLIESTVAALLVVATLLLRIIYVFHYRIDTDEPQHLHVVWSWVQGLLQYRDVFDNHAPLFHLMCAPLLAIVGERADIVPEMRLAMLPFYVLAVCCTYAIAATLFSRRVAVWAAVLTALFSGFFLTSLEFRPDSLWAALWLLGLALLVCGQATAGRCLGVGVLFGAALGVSLKTVLLLASVALAALAAPVLVGTRGDAPRSWRRLATRLIALLVGLIVVPASLIVFFAERGALTAMYYGTIVHNALPGLGLWHSAPSRVLLIPIASPLLWIAGRRIGRGAPTAAIGRRRVLIFLTAGIFLVLLFSVWPLVTHEDFLPVDPLVVLLATGIGLTYPSAALVATRRLRQATRFALPIAMVAIEAIVLVRSAPPWQEGTRNHADLVAAVLRLTASTDYVMDVKGETIFRRRPFFYALEHITKTRLQRGLIADDIGERLVATHTAVVTMDQSSFPPSGRAFMNENYLAVGAVRVLGRFLTATPTSRSASAAEGSPHGLNESMHFDIAIPARYAIIAEDGRADGLLDGTPYEGPRVLETGAHEFVSSGALTRLALVWASALERGFSPFQLGSGHEATAYAGGIEICSPRKGHHS